MAVALYVLVALAPLVSIALASVIGAGFAVSFYVLALVVLGLVELATTPEQIDVTHAARRQHLLSTQPDHRRSP